RLSEEEDFVDIPPTAEAAAVPAGGLCELGPERLGPGEHRPGRHVDPSLRQQQRDLPGGQREAQVPADSGEDRVGWPPVAGERGGRVLGEAAATRAAGEALAATGIVAVPVSGRLLAGRTVRHGHGPYQRPSTTRTLREGEGPRLHHLVAELGVPDVVH